MELSEPVPGVFVLACEYADRRLPKRGFTNIFAKHYVVVNIGRLQQAIDAGKLSAEDSIDGAALKAAGLIKSPRDGVRLLAKGEIKAKVNISVAGASKAAVEAVEKAGGSVTLLAAKPAPQADGGSEAPAQD